MHAVGELSRLRREHINPALKPEYYSLLQRRKRVKLLVRPLSGTDLAKQIRDVKDASNIGQKIDSGHKLDAQKRQRPYRHSYPDRKRHKGYGNNTYKQPF